MLLHPLLYTFLWEGLDLFWGAQGRVHRCLQRQGEELRQPQASLGQRLEDGVHLLCHGCQGEFELVLGEDHGAVTGRPDLLPQKGFRGRGHSWKVQKQEERQAWYLGADKAGPLVTDVLKSGGDVYLLYS